MGSRERNRNSKKEAGPLERGLRQRNWKEQLEKLESRWVFDKAGNGAAWLALRNQLWECLYAACLQDKGEYTDDERAAAAVDLLADLERYDPENYHLPESSMYHSKLVSYCAGCISRRLKDAYSKGIDLEYDPVGQESPVQEGKTESKAAQRRKLVRGKLAVSLNRPLDSEEETAAEAMDLVADPSEDHQQVLIRKEQLAALMVSFLAQVKNFDAVQKGQRRNDIRRLHYDLCYTEQFCHFAMKQMPAYIEAVIPRHFRWADVLRAVRKPYLHYFCEGEPLDSPRPLEALSRCGLKSRGACIPGGEQDLRLQWREDGFLEAKVPIAYLEQQENRKTGADDISRYRADYMNDVKTWMGSLGYDH